MSDDLVRRLRNLDTHPEGAPCKAADRIEELLKDVEVANDAIDHWKAAYDIVETKLAKVVEALESIAHESVDDEGIYTARRALKELNGEKNDDQ